MVKPDLHKEHIWFKLYVLLVWGWKRSERSWKTAKLEAYQFDEDHTLPKEKLKSLTEQTSLTDRCGELAPVSLLPFGLLPFGLLPFTYFKSKSGVSPTLKKWYEGLRTRVG